MDVENDMDLRAVNPKTDKMEVALMSPTEDNDSCPSEGEESSVSDHSCVGPGTWKPAAPKASAAARLPLSTLLAQAAKASAARKAEQKEADALLLQEAAKARSTLQQKSAELGKTQRQGKKKGAAALPSNTDHTSAKDHMERRAAKRARKAEAGVQVKPEQETTDVKRTRRAVAETRKHGDAVASVVLQSAAKAARQAARQERAAAEAKADAKLAKQKRKAAEIADRDSERKAANAANKLAKQEKKAAAGAAAEASCQKGEQSAAKTTRRAAKAAQKAAAQEDSSNEAAVVGDEVEAADVPVLSIGEAAAADDSDGPAAAADDNGLSISSASENEFEGDEEDEEDDKEDDEEDGEEDFSPAWPHCR